MGNNVTTKKVNHYRDLIVWKKSMFLVKEVYEVTGTFPSEEKYGLISQMRRCAVSIPSNVAEGNRRGTKKDFRKFLTNAFGSGAELETQITISKMLNMTSKNDFKKVDQLLEEIMKMLNKMIYNMKE